MVPGGPYGGVQLRNVSDSGGLVGRDWVTSGGWLVLKLYGYQGVDLCFEWRYGISEMMC